LFAAAGDLRGEGWSLHRLSETWEWRDYGREIDDLRSAYRSFVRARDRWGRAIAAQDLAFLLTPSGGPEYRKWLSVARGLAEDEGDLRAAADLLRTQGYHAAYRGSFAEAVRTMNEARPLAAEAGDRYAEADALMIGALASTAAGSPADAEAKASEALSLAAELGSVRVRVGALHAGARAALRRGDRAGAAARLRAAAQAVRRHRITTMAGDTAMVEAWVAIDRGAWDEVALPARRLASQARTNGWRLWEPLAPLFVGRAHLGGGRPGRAVAPLGKAAELAARVGADGTEALARALLAQASILAGRPTAIARGRAREPEVAAAWAEVRGLSAIVRGDAGRAAERFDEGIGVRAELGASVWLGRAHALHAASLRLTGDRRAAATAQRRAIRALKDAGTPLQAHRALLEPLDGGRGRKSIAPA
jgi:ATP/maltotriose-dependent transcriptional regulator MalT